MLFRIIIFIIIIIMLYLLAVMPKLRHNPKLNSYNGWLFAHRGLHNNKTQAPENSIPAFRLAVDNGYGIELDVQLTKDDVPVILHDYHLRRACKTDILVADLTYKELQQYRIFKSNEKIPTLPEALACIDGKVPIIVELKIPKTAGKICSIVSKILNDYKGEYCIESFNPYGLLWYRKHYPEVIRGQLSSDFNKEKKEGSKVQYFILKNLLFNFYTKPDFIAYHHIYRKDLSYRICHRLYRSKTFAWTIKSQEELEDNSKYFDFFIFDSFIPKI